MFRHTGLNVYSILVVLFFFGNIELFAQFEVKKRAFKESSSLNNTVGFSGASINVFFRDAANRHREFARKFKSSNFEGELNYWYVDSTSNEFSYELFDCDLGSNPILIITDFNWNINRINMIFRDKNFNVELKILKTVQNGKYFYKLVKSSGMCTSKEEFDFYLPAIELTIRDLSEVYNSLERIADQKYVGKIEYEKFQNSTDSLLRNMNMDFNDKISELKKAQNSTNVTYKGFRSNLGLQGFASPALNSCFQKNLNLLMGINYKFKNFEFGIAAGAQGLNQTWGSAYIPYVESRLNSTDQHFDDLFILGKNVKEDYNLKVNSVLLGLDMKVSSEDSRLFGGVYVNYIKPFSSDLSYTNSGGLFDYVGLSNSIEEPLLNITELGLVSNISYLGHTSNLAGFLKSFWQLGGSIGYSVGEKSLLDIYFSIGYITSKKFDLETTNTVISSSYGNYNSLLTVNNSQVAIPGYLNFGFGIRKYLN
jgi:hypothetical protein